LDIRTWLPLLCAACAPAPPHAEPNPSPWPEAEVLFRQDPAWRGGDGAFSIELDEERRLWLFGDSFVDRPGAVGRAGCAMPRNTVAVQHGRDPRTARMEFRWRGSASEPRSWFADEGDAWFWPLHGLRVDGAVLVFATRVRSTGEAGPFGFRADGWAAFRIDGVDAGIDDWTVERLATPGGPTDLVVGHAVLDEGAHVLAYALREPGDHALGLLRWPRAAFAAGDLLAPEWFDGAAWRPWSALVDWPTPIVAAGAPEFSVHRLPEGGFTMLQSLGFPAGELALRHAPRPEGPWSEARVLFRPPECDLDGTFVYAGKAHAGLWDGGLVATYATNAWDFGELVRDLDRYWPRCVRLPWALCARAAER
jgi:hypothetical protein